MPHSCRRNLRLKVNALPRAILLLSCIICSSAASAETSPARHQQLSLIFKEHSRHQEPDGPPALGQLLFTEGAVATDKGVTTGSYNTRRMVIGISSSQLVTDNLIYVNLPDGTLTYTGISSTAPDYSGAPVALRTIVGGTGHYAGARGIARVSGDANGIRVEIVLE